MIARKSDGKSKNTPKKLGVQLRRRFISYEKKNLGTMSEKKACHFTLSEKKIVGSL